MVFWVQFTYDFIVLLQSVRRIAVGLHVVVAKDGLTQTRAIVAAKCYFFVLVVMVVLLVFLAGIAFSLQKVALDRVETRLHVRVQFQELPCVVIPLFLVQKRVAAVVVRV